MDEQRGLLQDEQPHETLLDFEPLACTNERQQLVSDRERAFVEEAPVPHDGQELS